MNLTTDQNPASAFASESVVVFYLDDTVRSVLVVIEHTKQHWLIEDYLDWYAREYAMTRDRLSGFFTHRITP